MPFCSKCGAELDEGTKFCPSCGTPVGPPVAKPERRKAERRPLNILAIVLIVLIAGVSIIVSLSFLPIRTCDISETREVSYQEGIDKINLNFIADVAGINVAFEDLVDKLITLDVSVKGRVAVFGSSNLLDLTFDHTTSDNVLNITSEVDIVDRSWLRYYSLNVTCVICIDPSMNASLNVKTSIGGIVLDTQAGVVLNSLNLEATTGGVEANLVENVVLAGDVTVKTVTGGTKLSWDNLAITKNVQVNATTTTGGVDVDIIQPTELLRNITVNAEATTGGVDFSIDIQGDVGAKIEAETTTGGINKYLPYGFSTPTDQLVQSTNYPDSNNFEVNLKTTTGGININARYTE